jgi:gluconokinase
MVIFVMGSERSDRNSLGRMLAIALDWEFADANELRPTYVSGVPDNIQDVKSTSLKKLFAALRYWVYDWHDIVVSCWTLSQQDRKLLARNLSLVKFIYLRSPAHSLEGELSQLETGVASLEKQSEAREKVMTVDPSRKTKEIIAEIIGVFVLNRRAQDAIAS